MKKTVFLFFFFSLFASSFAQNAISVSPSSNISKYSNNKVLTSSDFIYTDMERKVPENNKIEKPCLLVYKLNGEFASFDLNTKQQNWSFTFDDGTKLNSENEFRLINGVVYLASFFNQLAALDVNTGKFFWKVNIGSEKYSRYMLRNQNLPINDNLIYIASCNSNLYALDRYTGKISWNYRLAYPYSIYPPIISGKYLFINNAPYIYSFDARTGEPLWIKDVSNTAMYAELTANEKYLFAGEESRIFYALDKETGEIVWKIDFDKEKDEYIDGKPVILHKNVLYLNTKSQRGITLHAIDSEQGLILWSKNIDEKNQDVPEMKIFDHYIVGYVADSYEDKKKMFVIDINTNQDVLGEQPSDMPTSNFVLSDENEIVFLGQKNIVSYNLLTKMFSYEEFLMNDTIEKASHRKAYINIVK